MALLSLRAVAHLCLLPLLVGAMACATTGTVEPANDDEPDGVVTGIRNQRERLGGDEWTLPGAVREAGEAQSIQYDDAPSWSGGANCTGSFTAGAQTLGDYVKANFSGVSSVEGYSCRQNTANASKTSMHGTGRAIDIMIPTSGGGADSGAGDPIANWLVEHASEIGVQYIIWNHISWNGSRTGRKDKPYTGPIPHIDHLHVELNEAGADQQTPWFQNGGSNQQPTGSNQDPGSNDPGDQPYESGPYESGDPGSSDPGSNSGGCGSVDEVGQCSGSTLRYCDNGQLATIDCAAQGMTCGDNPQQGYKDCLSSGSNNEGADPAGDPSSDPYGNSGNDPYNDPGSDPYSDPGADQGGGCGNITTKGVCQGNTLKYCNNGQLVTMSCGTDSCGLDGGGYYDCLVGGGNSYDDPGYDSGDPYGQGGSSAGGCGAISGEGECNGKTLTFCADGQLETINCGAQGMKCGWSSQYSYYDCL